MEKRIIILGEVDEFLKKFCNYLISKDIEIYLALRKNEDLYDLDGIDGKISIIKYSDELEEVKFLLKSIEPEIIYNLYGLISKSDLNELIEKFFLKNILLLEALKTSNSIKFINLVERIEKDKNEVPLNLYAAIIDSFNKVNLYYRYSYNIETKTKYRDEYEKIISRY